MIRILVFSDSHGYTVDMIKIIKNIPNVDFIIHLGDVYSDVLNIKKTFPDMEIHTVCGNNDRIPSLETEKLITVADKKIFITHGHNYSVSYTLKKLTNSTFAKEADIILYGHTHIPDHFSQNGKIIANPGSISRSRYGENSYGVLEIEDGKAGYANIFI